MQNMVKPYMYKQIFPKKLFRYSALYVKLYQHYEKRSMKERIFANMRFAVSDRANF